MANKQGTGRWKHFLRSAASWKNKNSGWTLRTSVALALRQAG